MYELVDFGVVRKYIDEQFCNLRLGFEYSLERIIDDFVLTLFLCGNDFLPALPTLHIDEGALNYFFTLYKKILPTLPGICYKLLSVIEYRVHYGRGSRSYLF